MFLVVEKYLLVSEREGRIGGVVTPILGRAVGEGWAVLSAHGLGLFDLLFRLHFGGRVVLPHNLFGGRFLFLEGSPVLFGDFLLLEFVAVDEAVHKSLSLVLPDLHVGHLLTLRHVVFGEVGSFDLFFRLCLRQHAGDSLHQNDDPERGFMNDSRLLTDHAPQLFLPLRVSPLQSAQAGQALYVFLRGWIKLDGISAEAVIGDHFADVFLGGITSYANEAKQDVLGVQQKTIESFGAVSEECALQMAEGARKALNTDIAVSVTGIAGPGGEEPGKPVGTVWMGVSTEKSLKARMFTFEGSRQEVRVQTVSAAFDAILERIQAES